jgi:3-hydroxyacyl-[acyl-carrier-protein] dehydratase
MPRSEPQDVLFGDKKRKNGRNIAVEEDCQPRYTSPLRRVADDPSGTVRYWHLRFPMRFTYIDRITDLEPGHRITATKSLSLTEDYLKDHFPRFPIMPGVLMLEAMYQTAAWLVRATDEFAHSMVMLSEANNVKYSDFVEPGETLQVTAELIEQKEQTYRLKCHGEVGGGVAVRGRLVLNAYLLSEEGLETGIVDRRLIRLLREKFQILYPSWPGESNAN